MPVGGNGRSGTAVFRENFVAICTHDRRLWIRIWIWMANYFHIHGKPVMLGSVARH